MRNKLALSLVCSAVLFTAGCNNTTPAFDTSVTPVPMTALQTRTEARIFGSLIVLNENEIKAGNLAQAKSANPAVKNFASMMVSDHSANLARTQNIAQRLNVAPVKGPIARMLQMKGNVLMSRLNRLNGPAFDKAYMMAMVKGHTDALRILDTKLIPEAVNPAVKAHLQQTRARVAGHLDQAKVVLQGL